MVQILADHIILHRPDAKFHKKKLTIVAPLPVLTFCILRIGTRS